LDARFERHHPPVEQVLRRAALASEVVDDEDAAVGQRLNRRAVHAAARVEPEAERFERELPADRDHRTLAQDPSLIESLAGPFVARRRRHRLVYHGVEKADDLAL